MFVNLYSSYTNPFYTRLSIFKILLMNYILSHGISLTLVRYYITPLIYIYMFIHLYTYFSFFCYLLYSFFSCHSNDYEDNRGHISICYTRLDELGTVEHSHYISCHSSDLLAHMMSFCDLSVTLFSSFYLFFLSFLSSFDLLSSFLELPFTK